MNAAIAKNLLLIAGASISLFNIIGLLHDWKKFKPLGRFSKAGAVLFGVVVIVLTAYVNDVTAAQAAPRHLTDAQYRTIENAAMLYAPRDAVVGFDSQISDGRGLATDIARAMSSAGWRVGGLNMDVMNAQATEVAVTIASPRASVDGGAARYLTQALIKAGFSVSYTTVSTALPPSSLTSIDGKTLITITPSISVTVGGRPSGN